MSRLLNNIPLFAPVDDAGGNGSPSSSEPMGTLDMIEFLGEDNDQETIDLEGKPKKEAKEKPESKPAKEDKGTIEDDDKESEEDDSEEDELKELEEEIEEPSDEQLELVTPVRRREILKKYPHLFKDFPYLEKAYYREQQFTELLPTIQDAKHAVEKSAILDRFEQDVMGGKTENILKAVKETNGDAFNRLVDDYLPTLARIDEKAYYHVLGNVTKHTIMSMVDEARRTKNTQLQGAAHLLNQFVFGTSEFQPPKNLASDGRPEDTTREKQLSEREQGFVRQQFESTRGELNTRVNNSLRNTIEANIDPKQSMTEYVRKNASRDAMDTLETQINQDNRFKALVDKLWEKAFEENFSRTAVDRIRSAYVSKAKTLLPSVIKKARNEALRGMGKRVSDDDTTPKKGPVPAGRPRSQNPTGKTGNAKDIPKGMSTLEFLNSE